MTAKRVFIVHGWGGHPDEGWFPWLSSELGSEIIVEHGMSHFSDDRDNVTELPVALEAALKIAG